MTVPAVIVRTDADELDEWVQERQRFERTRRDAAAESDSTNEDDIPADEHDDPDAETAYETYLSQQRPAIGRKRAGAFGTSDHTLADLPPLAPAEFRALLATAPRAAAGACAKLAALHRRQFPQWRLELDEGFNILFYGYGSKRQLLNEFAAQTFNDGPTVVANGYFPAVTAREIVARVWRAVECFAPFWGAAAGGVDVTGGADAHLLAIDSVLSAAPTARVYIVIHSLDGSTLRSDAAQKLLSKLADIPRVSLVASIDHVNAPLLWDNVKAQRYNWVCHDVTSFEPYAAELSYESSGLLERDAGSSVRGAQFVLASLTSNAKRVFCVLAEHQLAAGKGAESPSAADFDNDDHDDDSDDADGRPSRQAGSAAQYASIGLSYRAYFALCRERFLVSNDVSFRAQLTEFRDHEIIQCRRGRDGSEILYVPLAAGALSQLVESSRG